MPTFGRRFYGKGGRRQKPEEDGYIFDSKIEHGRYRELKLLLRAGKIKFLKVHPRFILNVWRPGTSIITEVGHYTPDFEYTGQVLGTWMHIVEDVKGYRVSPKTGKKLAIRSRGEAMAKKLVKALYGIDVQEVLR